VGRPSYDYEPRHAADSVLYQVVRDHYETFRARAASWRDGEGLPRFIDDEFRGFLRCGWLAGGFARFQCKGCHLDRLIAFSCKGRLVCPSCGGRRMTERAAHLVDHVFPEVPVRQWVLTVPHRVRYALAFDHALCRAVVGVFMRAVLGFLRRRARTLHGIGDGRSGPRPSSSGLGRRSMSTFIPTHSWSTASMRRRETAACSFAQPRPRLRMRWTSCW
jgi:hypothetical protein